MSKILILDDDQNNIDLFTLYLKKVDNIDIISFTHPKLALEWSVENEPDLVLVDYSMPEIDGLEFITRFIKIAERKSVPIIMLTAENSDDLKIEAIKLGALEFLNKSVSKVEFLARINTVLELRQSRLLLANKAKLLEVEVKKATNDLLKREKEIITRLSKAAEHRDPETGQHLVRMANYSKLIAKKLGFSELIQELILESAPMHDIGKLGTPDNILLKPGKLTDEEFVIMQHHAIHGFEILNGSDSILIQTAALIAKTHHEKFDGSGYPYGLKNEEIHIYGRIIAVADVFDALTSPRPYKKAWSLDDAVNFLHEQTNKHFDPRCVKAFLDSWDDVLVIYNNHQDHPDDLPLINHP